MSDGIHEIKRQNEKRLMALCGVVSVGVGRDSGGNPAIIVGLKDATAAARQVPDEISGYPVVLQTVGGFKAQ